MMAINRGSSTGRIESVEAFDGKLFIDEHRALVSVAEACWRPIEPSYSWHLLDWMCWKQRRKLQLMGKRDMAITMAAMVT